jgi:hypothetical protein
VVAQQEVSLNCLADDDLFVALEKHHKVKALRQRHKDFLTMSDAVALMVLLRQLCFGVLSKGDAGYVSVRWPGDAGWVSVQCPENDRSMSFLFLEIAQKQSKLLLARDADLLDWDFRSTLVLSSLHAAI